MLRIIDEEKGIDLTPKFALSQEVVAALRTTYRKGVVVGIAVNTNAKGTVVLYSVEMYVGKRSKPVVNKCLEKNLFTTPRDALLYLAEKAKEQENKESQSEVSEDQPKTEE